MTGPAPAFDAGTLLRHLACELARLADTADAIQHGASCLAQHRTAEAEAAEFPMIQLQALDSLSQVLRDLQRLTHAAAETRLARCRADPAFVRRSVLLQSLAERLIAGPGHDDGHDPAAFLL